MRHRRRKNNFYIYGYNSCGIARARTVVFTRNFYGFRLPGDRNGSLGFRCDGRGYAEERNFLGKSPLVKGCGTEGASFLFFRRKTSECENKWHYHNIIGR